MMTHGYWISNALIRIVKEKMRTADRPFNMRMVREWIVGVLRAETEIAMKDHQEIARLLGRRLLYEASDVVRLRRGWYVWNKGSGLALHELEDGAVQEGTSCA